MDALDAIKQRRSVKHYDPDHKMTDQEISDLLALARLSPTAFNLQNYRFVVVKDKELRAQIRAVSWDQAQVTDASALIILCGDLKAWEKSPRRYWENAPQDVQDFIVTAADDYYRNKETVQRDEVMRSAGMAAQTIMLAAKTMGYDTCPMDGFDFDAVGDLINLPEDHAIAMFVVVGKPVQPARERPTQIPNDEVIIIDRF